MDQLQRFFEIFNFGIAGPVGFAITLITFGLALRISIRLKDSHARRSLQAHLQEEQKRIDIQISKLPKIQVLNDELIEFKDYAEDFTVGSEAAGDGFAYGDADENYRTFMVTEIPELDMSVDVKGNSMFPTIYDGNVAFVKTTFDKTNRFTS